ncbi:MAG: hypothetical protein LBM98_07210 [Oscillospiraceae bacterium]|jgi:membrane protein implicated in regulation of membrane protease activity|nr:hypothetical protein [Oscillospiraceae bacterium]
MKKGNHEWRNLIVTILICAAIVTITVLAVGSATIKYQTERPPLPPLWLRIVSFAIIAGFVIPLWIDIVRRILRPKVAKENALAENDERGRAIEARASVTASFLMYHILAITGIISFWLGENNVSVALITAGFATQCVKRLCKAYYRRKM